MSLDISDECFFQPFDLRVCYSAGFVASSFSAVGLGFNRSSRDTVKMHAWLQALPK